jgi:hypothetical protein
LKRRLRPIKVDGDVAIVHLTRGYVAVIDAADVPLVDQWNWCAEVSRKRDGSFRTVYAMRTDTAPGKKAVTVKLHRVILGAEDDAVVDHKDGDGLNNRRTNLRPATGAQNNFNSRKRVDNSSGKRGVHWHKVRKKWRAEIQANGKKKHLGLFCSIEEAAAAYLTASESLHGEYGRPD